MWKRNAGQTRRGPRVLFAGMGLPQPRVIADTHATQPKASQPMYRLTGDLQRKYFVLRTEIQRQFRKHETCLSLPPFPLPRITTTCQKTAIGHPPPNLHVYGSIIIIIVTTRRQARRIKASMLECDRFIILPRVLYCVLLPKSCRNAPDRSPCHPCSTPQARCRREAHCLPGWQASRNMRKGCCLPLL